VNYTHVMRLSQVSESGKMTNLSVKAPKGRLFLKKSNEITLIFDSVNAGPQELKRIFEVSRTLGEAVPFTSKGGALGLKILCNAEEAQTIAAVNQLESALSLVLTD